MTTRIILTGATGWVGRALVPAITDTRDLALVGAVARSAAGRDLGEAIGTARLGNASFDVRYTATIEQKAVCVGTVTYVSVKPGTHDSVPIPDVLRDRLQEAHVES